MSSTLCHHVKSVHKDNLGEGKHSHVRIVSIMLNHKEVIHCSVEGKIKTQEILSQSHLGIFHEADRSSKKIICEDCGFSELFNLSLTQDTASQVRGRENIHMQGFFLSCRGKNKETRL